MLIYSNDILKISCDTIFDQGDIITGGRKLFRQNVCSLLTR